MTKRRPLAATFAVLQHFQDSVEDPVGALVKDLKPVGKPVSRNLVELTCTGLTPEA